MNSLDKLKDEVMAMDFAFKVLARALHRNGVLPLPQLAEQLGAVAEQIRQTSDTASSNEDMSHVSAQLDELRASLLLLQ